MIDLHNTECLAHMRTMPDNSVDAIVTDPPYGLSFMGKKWDYDVPSVEVWEECLRVLKPGGHLLAFAGTRTQHRMAVRIEDAGFEIRDMIAWVYGSGFPKSLDVSKAIDKAAGTEHLRQFICENPANRPGNSGSGVHGETATTGNGWRKPTRPDKTAPATPAAQKWQGWGTALKPALEPITMARKPLSGTVAENVLEHGTGALNVDGCRVEGPPSGLKPYTRAVEQRESQAANHRSVTFTDHTAGRWPANLIHDGSDEVVGLFPQTGVSNGRRVAKPLNGFAMKAQPDVDTGYGDSGSAARFFYCAKASKADRDEGCEGFEVKRTGGMSATDDGSMLTGSGNERTTARANVHPTVKPTDLMRYLCRLVTPPGGTILDPFMGSGSTGKAAKLEGFNFIGIEREAEYVAIAQARIDGAKMDAKHYANASRHAQRAVKQPTLFDAARG
jgi:site-specific DNA-methyltransferase (adenine-specific)